MIKQAKKGSTYNPEIYTKEAKKARFYRVGERRINKILKYLKLVGNMSNKNLYLYTDQEVKKMFNVLKTMISKTEDKFQTGSQQKEYSFKF